MEYLDNKKLDSMNPDDLHKAIELSILEREVKKMPIKKIHVVVTIYMKELIRRDKSTWFKFMKSLITDLK